VSPCEKSFSKFAKFRKNRERLGDSYLINSDSYNKLKRLENSELVTGNPRVGSSILLPDANKKASEVFHWSFFFLWGYALNEPFWPQNGSFKTKNRPRFSSNPENINKLLRSDPNLIDT
jgi:hypothetical protein